MDSDMENLTNIKKYNHTHVNFFHAMETIRKYISFVSMA